MATPPPPYDPSGWSDTDPSTWPPPIPPATLYQPGMAWTMTAAGVVAGQPVAVGDLLFVVHADRLYGDALYGDGMWGSTPDGDWTAEDVTFVAWYSSAPPQDQPPFPYSGCKLGDTGWWVIVDAFYLDTTGSRLYGDRLYGDGEYGGSIPATVHWVDVTAGFTGINITRGSADGTATPDVIEIDVEWDDPDFLRVDVAPPAVYYQPFVGVPLRVSLYDPAWGWHPRAVGSIEQIVDPTIHPSSEQQRFVRMQAFGHIMDTSRTLFGWQRPAELASARFAALLTATGWRYGQGAIVYPPDIALHADTKPRDVTGRDELDRTVRSAGWTFDTDRRGMPRLRPWPLPLLDPVAVVVDCPDQGVDGLEATMIVFNADESQLLNVVTMTNGLDPATRVTSTDPTSVAVYGARDNTLGFPATGLAFAAAADGQAIVERVRARYSRIVTKVEPLTVDTAVDAGWLPILADVDTGEHLHTVRTHPTRFELHSIVVGVDEAIAPDRIAAVLFTTTTTPTT